MSLIKTIYVKISDTLFRTPRADSATHSLATIDVAHHAIHDGKAFTTNYSKEAGMGVTFEMLVVTPNTPTWAHMTYELFVEADGILSLYEGAITTADGTAVTAFNRDRNSAATATVVVTHTPTIAADGTLLRSWYLKGGSVIGGSPRGDHEFILKQNTKYLFRTSDPTYGTGRTSLKLNWYECANKG